MKSLKLVWQVLHMCRRVRKQISIYRKFAKHVPGRVLRRMKYEGIMLYEEQHVRSVIANGYLGLGAS
jgi:hypothetical protein